MKFNFYAIKLCVIMIVIFLLQLLFSGFTELFLLNESSYVQIWRFISSIFLHGSAVHLLYNLFALMLFGSILERLTGGKRFLILFFVTGILANIVSVNFYSSSLGASGAIFGIIGGLIIVRPGQTVWAFGMPMPIFLAGVLWVVGDVIGIFVPSNTANIAHLAGIGFGVLFGIYYRHLLERNRRKENVRIAIDENLIRNWEDAYLR